MKEEILLLSEEYIKSYGIINDNTDGCYLQPAMVLAQEVGLQEIIGTKLLKKIKKLISTNDINIEEFANYKELLEDYIIPYLLWETTSEIQMPISFKTANSGTVQNTDTNKYASSIEDVEYMKNYYKDKSRFFAKLLTDYLYHNSNTFKEWPGSCKDGLVGGTENYSGIYFVDTCSNHHYDYDKK